MVTLVDHTHRKLLLGNNEFYEHTFTAGGALTYPKGMVLGQLTATGKLVPYNSAGVAGEEVPMAILREELVASGAGDLQIRPCISGKYHEDEVTAWNGGTPIALTFLEIQQLRDVGLISQVSTENQIHDNS